MSYHNSVATFSNDSILLNDSLEGTKETESYLVRAVLFYHCAQISLPGAQFTAKNTETEKQGNTSAWHHILNLHFILLAASLLAFLGRP